MSFFAASWPARCKHRGLGCSAGEPVPSGMGRKTLAQVAKEYKFDLKAVLVKLEDQNIQATENMTIKEVAEAVGMAPHDVLEMMK